MTETEHGDPASIGVGGLRASGHRARARRGRGCLPVLLIVLVVGVIAALGYVKGVDFVKNILSSSPAADYTGDGQKPAVVVAVHDGDTATDIGNTLVKAGVVKSVKAFTEEAGKDERSLSIQVGRYQMLSKMSARSALLVLVDPGSLIKNPTVTIPEGLRASEVLASIAKQTDFSLKQLQAAYDDTASLGLPAYADGDPEGYLFPSTYDVKKSTTAASLLHDMVAKFSEQATSLDLEREAKALGYGPGDIVTIASLIQAESGTADMAKVSSVVYNRLDIGMALQFDSTLHYALNLRGDVVTTDEQRQSSSPYNSYLQTGLPPTPIDAPGTEALQAALAPAKTDYLYFVTVNLATGETKFASTLEEHNRNVAQYREFCTTSDEC